MRNAFSIREVARSPSLTRLAALRSGIVGAWMPNFSRGSYARDLVGANHLAGSVTLAQTNAVVGNGTIGRVWSFNGSSSYLAARNSPLLDWNGDVTVAYWFNFTSTAGNQMLIGETDLGSASVGWQVYLSSGTIKHQFYTDAGLQQIYTPAAPSTGFWRQCVIRKRGTTASVLWSSGETGSNTISGTYTKPTAGIALGKFPNLGTYWMNGLLGPVHLWSRYLTDAEVIELNRSTASPMVRASSGRHFQGWVAPVASGGVGSQCVNVVC